MMISTKGRYALRVMLDLAASDPKKHISLKSIAEKQGISEKYLEAIIRLLVKGNLVVGTRGKGGGYRLTKSPSECTIGDVLRLCEGTLAPVSCLDCNQGDVCPRSDDCLTLPIWQGLDDVINTYLDDITLESVLRRER